MFLPRRPTEEAIIILEKLGQATCNELKKKCIHGILSMGQKNAPIKRLELNKLVFKNPNYRVAAAITQLANKELMKTFGLRLFELEDKSKYLLVNMTTNFNTLNPETDKACDELSLLFLILMEIFVSPDEKIPIEDIEGAMKALKFSASEIVGHIDALVRRLYLTSERSQETRLIGWGPRAVAEVDPDVFFTQFLELAKDTTDKDWPDLKKRIDILKSIPNR